MAEHHSGKLTILIGIILIIDALVGIQAMFTNVTVTSGVNVLELILGIAVAGMGWKMHGMKM